MHTCPMDFLFVGGGLRVVDEGGGTIPLNMHEDAAIGPDIEAQATGDEPIVEDQGYW